MSCYEWERGEIILPSKEWVGFKKVIREAYNKLQTEAYDHALRIYKTLMEKGKGKRNLSPNQWNNWFNELATVEKGSGYYFYEKEIPMRDHVWGVLLNDIYAGRSKRPTRPKKKDFPKATNQYRFYDVGGEASIRFTDDKTRVVVWNVEENNHACDYARKTELAKVFFQQLKQVKWTRGTGGQIVGNDEYRRDDREAGGGGNYVKDSYGPKNKKGYVVTPNGSMSLY